MLAGEQIAVKVCTDCADAKVDCAFRQSHETDAL